MLCFKEQNQLQFHIFWYKVKTTWITIYIKNELRINFFVWNQKTFVTVWDEFCEVYNGLTNVACSLCDDWLSHFLIHLSLQIISHFINLPMIDHSCVWNVVYKYVLFSAQSSSWKTNVSEIAILHDWLALASVVVWPSHNCFTSFFFAWQLCQCFALLIAWQLR